MERKRGRREGGDDEAENAKKKRRERFLNGPECPGLDSGRKDRGRF